MIQATLQPLQSEDIGKQDRFHAASGMRKRTCNRPHPERIHFTLRGLDQGADRIRHQRQAGARLKPGRRRAYGRLRVVTASSTPDFPGYPIESGGNSNGNAIREIVPDTFFNTFFKVYARRR